MELALPPKATGGGAWTPPLQYWLEGVLWIASRALRRGFLSRGQFAIPFPLAVLALPFLPFQLVMLWRLVSCYHNKLLGYARVEDHPLHCILHVEETDSFPFTARFRRSSLWGIAPFFVRNEEPLRFTLPALKRKRRSPLAEPEPMPVSLAGQGAPKGRWASRPSALGPLCLAFSSNPVIAASPLGVMLPQWEILSLEAITVLLGSRCRSSIDTMAILFVLRHLAPKYIGHLRGLNVVMLPSFD
jgi:hypothetical protein